MESIRVKNLKSLTDSGEMKIKPLTILVGNNSSGKSSLMRCFPLFKQSSESKILGSVLWSGKYVDYGSFDESINSFSDEKNKEISFIFKFKLPEYKKFYFGRNSLISSIEGNPEVLFTLSVSGTEHNKNSYSIYTYEIYGNIISMRYNSDTKLLSATINDIDVTKEVMNSYDSTKSYGVIPVLRPKPPQILQRIQAAEELISEIKRHTHHKTSEERVIKLANELPLTEDDRILNILRNKNLSGDVAAKKFSQWKKTDQDFKKLKEKILISTLDLVIDQTNDVFRSFFSSTRYITPLRAAADRYYRIQNTSIEEIDPNGSNLAMFLHAKKPSEITEINKWLKAEIGFTIDIQAIRGHASIFIIDNELKSNIADTGFGFSQILPILIQIWQLSQKRTRIINNRKNTTTIIIEQPELHLHPKMQSKIGDAFCKSIKVAKENGVDLKIIIETHSKEVIHAIGECIERDEISHNDCIIYIVEKEKKINLSESHFDKNGFLTSWPYGFFDGA